MLQLLGYIITIWSLLALFIGPIVVSQRLYQENYHWGMVVLGALGVIAGAWVIMGLGQRLVEWADKKGSDVHDVLPWFALIVGLAGMSGGAAMMGLLMPQGVLIFFLGLKAAHYGWKERK